MRMAPLLSAIATLAAGSATAADAAPGTAGRCISAASLFSPAMFRKYPADPEWRGNWRAPDVRSGQAHRYRTVLRMEGVGPPDFAGHYKVAPHGCGAGSTCPMFVDLKTGKVTFVPSLQSVFWDEERAFDVERETGIRDSRLVYRRDSRLLVVLGMRNEDAKLTGAALYEPRDGGPRLIRFIPQRALCPGKEPL